MSEAQQPQLDTMGDEMNGGPINLSAFVSMPKSTGHIPDMVHMADVAVTSGLAKLVSF